MADIADRAAGPIEQTATDSVAAIRAQLAGDGQDYCDDCGNDLSPERRKAVPWAIRCVPCAEVFERKEGGYGRG